MKATIGILGAVLVLAVGCGDVSSVGTPGPGIGGVGGIVNAGAAGQLGAAGSSGGVPGAGGAAGIPAGGLAGASGGIAGAVAGTDGGATDPLAHCIQGPKQADNCGSGPNCLEGFWSNNTGASGASDANGIHCEQNPSNPGYMNCRCTMAAVRYVISCSECPPVNSDPCDGSSTVIRDGAPACNF